MAVPTKNNTVQPLNWQRPIVAPGGAATDEFQRAWAQQARANASIPDLTTAAAASAVLDLISSAPGSLLARGASAWGGLASPSDTTKFLNGSATPSWAQVTDADLLLSDITTNNVSTTKHGFAPKAPNDATKFLDGTGAYSTPSSGGGASSVEDDGTTLYFALTDPSGQLILDPSGNPIFAPIVLPVASLPAAGGYISGTLASATVNKVKGVTDGSAAAAGDVGEYIHAEVAPGSAVSINNNSQTNLTSISLAAGDWDVYGVVWFAPAASAQITLIESGINTVSGTIPAGGTLAATAQDYPSGFAQATSLSVIAGPVRESLSGTATIYLNAYTLFTVGTVTMYGQIRARRIR